MADLPAHPSGRWVHDLDPFLWQISGEIGIRWYGLAYLAGLVLGGLLLRRWIRQGRLPLRSGELQDLVFVVGLAMVIGGRLGYCLFYQPSLLISFGDGFPWWGVLRLMDGGMASHGGIAGLAVGAWWWSWRHRRPLGVLADAVAVGAPIGVVCGRLANFWNGELWGRPCDPSLPWGVVFPNETFPPAQTAAQIAALVPRHPSQLYAVGLEGLLPLLIAIPLHARHRRPGLSVAIILATYAVGRFVGEFFRQPDAGQPGSPGHDFILGFMSKGQALTLPVLVIAAGVAWWAWYREPMAQAYVLPGDAPQETPGPTDQARL